MNDNNQNLEELLKKGRLASSSLLSNKEIDGNESETIINNVVKKFSDREVLERELLDYNSYDSNAAYQNILSAVKPHQRRNRLVAISAVASSVAAVLVAFFIVYNGTEPTVELIVEREKLDIIIPQNRMKAELSDDKGNSSLINASTKEVRIGDKIVKNNPITASISYAEVPEDEAMNKLVVPKGGFYQLILQDGTTVTLNSDSYLEYPTSFNKKVREVTLVGEAFFEVAHRKNSPFIIKTKRGDIEVLGTVFNVKSYADEVYTGVTLVNGSVLVSNQNYSLKLEPGEKAVMEENGLPIEKRKVTIADDIAWTKNRFDYVDVPLEIVVKDIVRSYDVDIRIAKIELNNTLVTFYMSKDKSLEVVLDALSKSGILEVVKNGTTYIIK